MTLPVVSPPVWYCLWWIAFFAVLVIAVRIFLINPLVQETRALRAEVQALRQ